MKKNLLIGFTCALLLLLLAACGGGAPGEGQLTDMIPQEVLGYTLDGTEYTSHVDGLEIVRRQTNDKEDIAECRIFLSDSHMKRTAYLRLTCTYWDKGGWQLDSWEPYQDEEIQPLEPFDNIRFQNEIAQRGYNSANFKDITHEVTSETVAAYYGQASEHLWETSETHYCAAYSANDLHENLTITGLILLWADLARSDDYPMEYFWAVSADESMLSCQWDLTGRWTGTFQSYYQRQTRDAVLNIDINSAQPGVYRDTTQHYFTLFGNAGVELLGYDWLETTMESYEEAKQRGSGDSFFDQYYEWDFYVNGVDEYYLKICFYPNYTEFALADYTINGEYVKDERYALIRVTDKEEGVQ